MSIGDRIIRFWEAKKIKEKEWIEDKTWDEFRDTGLLWFINSILHMFGWAIGTTINDDGSVFEAYPMRVRYRGFSETCNSCGYEKVQRYMKENANELYDEAEYEEGTE